MSNIDPLDRYMNPPLPSKTDTIYKSYSHFSSIGHPPGEEEHVTIEQPNAHDYPSNASYARFPVMVNCKQCN